MLVPQTTLSHGRIELQRLHPQASGNLSRHAFPPANSTPKTTQKSSSELLSHCQTSPQTTLTAKRRFLTAINSSSGPFPKPCLTLSDPRSRNPAEFSDAFPGVGGYILYNMLCAPRSPCPTIPRGLVPSWRSLCSEVPMGTTAASARLGEESVSRGSGTGLGKGWASSQSCSLRPMNTTPAKMLA